MMDAVGIVILLLLLLFITYLRDIDNDGLDSWDRSALNPGVREGSSRDWLGTIVDQNGDFDFWGNLCDTNSY